LFEYSIPLPIGPLSNQWLRKDARSLGICTEYIRFSSTAMLPNPWTSNVRKMYGVYS